MKLLNEITEYTRREKPAFRVNYEHNGQTYFADLSNQIFEDECMIFECDPQTLEVVDYSEVWCDRDVELSRESLLRVINEMCDAYND